MDIAKFPISQAVTSPALAYRRKAATCGRLADCSIEPADRDRLLTMQESWLALAANEDWLAGAAAPQAPEPPR